MSRRDSKEFTRVWRYLTTTGYILQLYENYAERQYDQRIGVEVHDFVSAIISSSVVKGPL